MSRNFNNEQEEFWATEFGDEYIDRNQGQQLIASNVNLFAQVLRRAGPIRSVLEFGANIGLNLSALKTLLPTARFSGVEINKRAYERLSQIDGIEAYHSSIQDMTPAETVDLSFTKTVLIHINPGTLNEIYDKLYTASNRYVLVAEYYNPTPVEISYRGHTSKLFKRDFAGEMMDRHPDLKLIDYGFVYHGDRFSQDDITWFLMEKESN
jgi:pseudaminic acid biosynthesis-associated methylase